MSDADPALLDHGLVLALGGRCPLCAELARDAGVLARRPCSECGGVFADEAVSTRLVEAYGTRSLEHLTLHLAVLAVTALVLGFVPLLGAVCLLAGFVVYQHRVVAPALALLSRRRRVVSRWTMRLFVATLGVVTSVTITLVSFFWVGGLAAAIAVPGSVALSWLFSRRYLLRQLARERERLPVAAWELTLLVVSAALLSASAVVVAALVGASLALVQLGVEKLRGLL